MPNQIERDVFVTKNTIKNPIHYVRGTDLLPIVFHFRDFSIPSGVTARVFVAKPDGNAVYDSATIEGNDVTVDVTEQMFLVLGMTLLQISIFDGKEELVTFAQPVMVEPNLKSGDFPGSATDITFLDDAIKQANQAVETATAAASQAAQAVKNANQAIADANKAISDLNEQTASLNTNFALLSNNVSISQLGTTAKTIVGALNELNSKAILSAYAAPKPEDTEEFTVGDTYDVVVRKIGRIVSIQFNIVGTLSIDNKSVRLFTLNEGYAPISTILHNYISQSRNCMLLSINNTGAVNIATFDPAPVSGFILRQTITYIAAD